MDQKEKPTPSRRILVVEDHADAAEALALLLQRAGHVVQIAGTIEQAIRMIHARKYELILCDMTLPDGDGMAIPLIARLGNPGIRLVAISGRAAPNEISDILRAGFDAHLPKPFALDALYKYLV